MAVLTWSTGWEATSVALWSPVHAIEDDVVVTNDGAESLTSFERDLIVVNP